MKKLPAYKEAGAKCTDIMIILENGKIGKKNNREKSEVLVADCYCTRVGTFGTESAVRKRGGSRNLPYLNAKPRQIQLLDTYACTVTADLLLFTHTFPVTVCMMLIMCERW